MKTPITSGTPLPLLAPAVALLPGRLEDATIARRSAWPVVIVSMPWMEHHRPSIQLGLLKAIVAAHGFPVRTHHANLDLAAQLGVDDYRLLSEQHARMVGDWLFSLEAFGDAAPDPGDRLVDDFAEDLPVLGESPRERRERLLDVRHREVPAYLDALADAILADGPRVVGFTSTFEQNAASFALARRLKRRDPGIVAVFGGANFDGEMGLELVRAVDCVDLAVIGEGDVAFPRLLAALADGTDPGAVPGVARRVGGRVVATPPAPPLYKLDELPVPDYDEYFERAERLGLLSRAGHRKVQIMFESARGCWWGAKHHCTFCGLNRDTMEFRAKSPRRVVAELAEQARRYRSFRFTAVDNILDPRYLTDLFPVLTETAADYELFYEVKANLTRAHLKLMARAGVGQIQPGLESLSTNVLRLMRKGVRAAQNVNVLRWARYYDIRVSWNILWGFPGETEQDYADQAAVLPHLVHLKPPVGIGRIWMERFSPLYTEPDEFGVLHRAPDAHYRYVYPDGFDLDRIAYFFEYELKDALPDSAYADLRREVRAWRAAWEAEKPPRLTYWSAPDFLQIYDGRHSGREGTYTFEGVLADIYLACSDRPIGATAVRDKLDRRVSLEEVQEAFAEFAERGLMFLDGSLAVALALPAVTGR